MPRSRNTFSIVFDDLAADFIRRCEDWLVQHQCDNNDVLSVAYAIDSGHPSFCGDNMLAYVAGDSGVSGCFIVTGNGRIHLPDMPLEILNLVCDELDARNVSLQHISATTPTAVEMASLWCLETERRWRIDAQWQMFLVDDIAMPESPADGFLRPPVTAERALVESWGTDYGIEKPAPIDVPTFLLGKMDGGELFLWDDNGPRALVAVSAKMKHYARISAVYTPPEYRCTGFASIAVATASRDLLAAGARVCSLSVVLNDEDVMRIYEKLGYRKANTRASIQFLDDRLD